MIVYQNTSYLHERKQLHYFICVIPVTKFPTSVLIYFRVFVRNVCIYSFGNTIAT